MSIKIAICDDNTEDSAQLSDALLDYDPLLQITTFTSGKMLMDEILEDHFYADLLFLDIYMPEMDGILTARNIRSKLKDVKIIFYSSSKDHYSQAYEVFAFNYIEKPFLKERLYAVLDRAFEELRKEKSYKISIQYKGAVQTVDYRDILYIESNNKMLLFHLADGNVPQCYGKLDKIMNKIPEQLFIRCHQSFLVNLSHVTEMKENYLRIGQAIISISRKYGKSAKEKYYTYLFSDMMGEPYE
jgi:DNA-binding LytR/AlgR family response regulator